VLERPGLDLGRDPGPQTADNVGAGDYDRRSGTGGGNHRLLLVHSDKHTESKVVKAVTSVVPGVSPEQAANCHNTAKQLGMAIITSCLKEHAEFYSFQLFQWECSTKIEPDTTTI
jgi:ATP-dependent Clp protease adapter protein ClpS